MAQYSFTTFVGMRTQTKMETTKKCLLPTLFYTLAINGAFASEWANIFCKSPDFSASNEWILLDATGLSWSDRRQAVATFWQNCFENEERWCSIQRCTDYFDAGMVQTGGLCAYVVKK